MKKTEILFCNKHGYTEFSLTGIQRTRWKCKKCTSEYSSKYVKNNKLKAIKYKGGCCSICNYNKSIWSLDFHHLDPNQKDFNISPHSSNNTKKRKINFDDLKVELDKCILVCKNCHYELHEKIHNDNKLNKLKSDLDKITYYSRKKINKINNLILDNQT